MEGKRNGQVTILHTNDIHGRTMPFEVVKGSATSQTGDPGRTWQEYTAEGLAGGFPALAAAIKRIRQERGGENVLLVDGGDTFSDDLLGNLTEGEAVIRMMKAMGYQLMALGNHDFDFGLDRTRELQEMGGFAMRGANIIEKATGEPVFGDPTLILEAGGLRVGFITLGYHNSDQTGNKKNVEPLEFANGLEATRKYLPQVREHADLVVVLSHMGTSPDRLLAQQVEDIDLIIGAHSHDFVHVEWIEGTPVVQAVSDASVLGDLILTVEAGRIVDIRHELHTLWNDEFPADEEMARLLDELRAPYREQLEKVIGQVAEPLGRNYRAESPFDKWVGEILCQELDTEIAFLPGVGYGVTLLPGPLTREALYTLIPHPAGVVTLELTGTQVLEILEQSATNQDPGDPLEVVGGLVQTAGLRYTVDYQRPRGSRVSNVQVRGEPIDRQRSYRAATNSGMQGGLHRYDTFAEGTNIRQHEPRLNELVESAILKMGTIRPPKMGDIVLIDKESGQQRHAA